MFHCSHKHCHCGGQGHRRTELSQQIPRFAIVLHCNYSPIMYERSRNSIDRSYSIQSYQITRHVKIVALTRHVSNNYSAQNHTRAVLNTSKVIQGHWSEQMVLTNREMAIHSSSFKVIRCCANQRGICDFLLALNSNLISIFNVLKISYNT